MAAQLRASGAGHRPMVTAVQWPPFRPPALRPGAPGRQAVVRYPVAVRMPGTPPPLPRPVRAELPHAAPASGRDDQTLAGVRVVDSDGWQPHSEQSMHALHVQMFL